MLIEGTKKKTNKKNLSSHSLPSIPRPKGDVDAESYYDTIVKFLTNAQQSMVFSGLSGLQRKKVHELAENFKLLHESSKDKSGKIVTITKISEKDFQGL